MGALIEPVRSWLAAAADAVAVEMGVVRRGDVLVAPETDEFIIRFGRDQRAMPPDILRVHIDCPTAVDAEKGRSSASFLVRAVIEKRVAQWLKGAP